MNSSPADEVWFFEHGLLHDARVSAVHSAGGALEISINDEWANERGLGRPYGESSPGVLVFASAAIIEGTLSEAAGGWISEVLLEPGGCYHFIFTNRRPLLIRAVSAAYRPKY